MAPNLVATYLPTLSTLLQGEMKTPKKAVTRVVKKNTSTYNFTIAHTLLTNTCVPNKRKKLVMEAFRCKVGCSSQIVP
jgi:hypothetical protein